MSERLTVLLAGASGRTGSRVLEQLLNRGVCVRAILRSPHKLSARTAKHPDLTIIKAALPSMSEEELQGCISGCDAVISCLGHNISFRGVFFPPHDLVTLATKKLCGAIESLRPEKPVKFILMSSVSVNSPHGFDSRRGNFEKAFLWVLRGLLPPARDNQLAADFLVDGIGIEHAFVQWTIVRPDTLLDGEISEYALNDGLVSSLFAPDGTNMANVAHFMCELATAPALWERWRGKLPVIINAAASQGSSVR